jgi:hypothetical protein
MLGSTESLHGAYGAPCGGLWLWNPFPDASLSHRVVPHVGLWACNICQGGSARQRGKGGKLKPQAQTRPQGGFMQLLLANDDCMGLEAYKLWHRLL